MECDNCDGTGDCPTCGGSGYIGTGFGGKYMAGIGIVCAIAGIVAIIVVAILLIGLAKFVTRKKT